MNNKGIYYSMDALLAGLLFVGVILLLFQNSFYEPNTDQQNFLSQDLLASLGSITLGESNYPMITAELSSGQYVDANNTVLELIGIYWALNQTQNATKIITRFVNGTVPDQLYLQLNLDGDDLYPYQNSTTPTNIIGGRRMITGIAQGKPLTGFSSSAYLKKVRNKKTSSYAYFGGYYAQGNISTTLNLPSDFSSSRIISARINIETPGTFDLLINGNVCLNDVTGLTTTVTSWDLINCNSSFKPNKNNISFIYSSELNVSAISGGLIKVTYTTDTLKEIIPTGYKRYYLPEIQGFINVYDAFSAQGLIDSWNLNMTFYNEYDTFVTIGNETIFIAPGSNTTQNIFFSRNNASLPPTEIPLRVGTTNLSNITIVQSGDPSDSFLVTDVSGSMDDCGLYYTENVTYCGYDYKFWFWWTYTECPYTGSCVSNECGGSTTTQNHVIYDKTVSTCNKTLMELAKEADDLFVDVVLGNSTLNEIGLIDFSTNANTPTDLTNIPGVLHSEISTYSAGGNTCTCCGINRAKDLLLSSDDDKFMVVLSDGEPTAYCNGFSDYTGSTGDNTQARNDAIASGQEACANNITVYTIGFGEGMSAQGHDIMRQIACNDSLYYNASNAGDLAEIYENISQDILVAANYSSQTINIVGNFTIANLSKDSYIDLYYTPIVQEDNQGKLSMVFESAPFGGCTSSVSIPGGVLIEDAYVTSFSSNHWTKKLDVNGINVFNLSEYGSDYTLLGDPFIIQVPSAVLIPGATNNFTLEVGDNPVNISSCSPNNTFIYTALINASTPRGETYEEHEGCTWIVESETGKNSTIKIPKDYSGPNNCSYTSASISYNVLDAYDSATHFLLSQLDPDNNGKIIVDLAESDLEITITLVSGIPYLWGPTLVGTQVGS
ncbi:VWA domain-containing protein [Candidatus Woesearchaeota archaeon]|nr:VWA domain-containing protein [Candidatus Woesearchaeota archaeon]